jgi:hypothetical protein
MIEKVGFTGTSKGMIQEQKMEVWFFLFILKLAGATTFYHGDCIGADCEAAKIAKNLGYYIICLPGFSAKNPESTLYRAFTDFNDEIFPSRPFLKRDQDIVNYSHIMIAAPLTEQEQTRSGTWTTVRFARKKGRKILLAFPSIYRV